MKGIMRHHKNKPKYFRIVLEPFPKASRMGPWPHRNRPGAVLVASLGHIEPSWPRLVASCGRLGASCGRLGFPNVTERQTQHFTFLLFFQYFRVPKPWRWERFGEPVDRNNPPKILPKISENPSKNQPKSYQNFIQKGFQHGV